MTVTHLTTNSPGRQALALVAWLALCFAATATAGLLLVPYLAWVSFAAALNFAIWRLNL